jgi:hypothetical protein
MALFASDETERGEWLPRPLLGEGERERDSYLRASCSGVEGTELECCEMMEGRWRRGSAEAGEGEGEGAASTGRLPAVAERGKPFGVIGDAREGTRGSGCLCSSR